MVYFVGIMSSVLAKFGIQAAVSGVSKGTSLLVNAFKGFEDYEDKQKAARYVQWFSSEYGDQVARNFQSLAFGHDIVTKEPLNMNLETVLNAIAPIKRQHSGITGEELAKALFQMSGFYYGEKVQRGMSTNEWMNQWTDLFDYALKQLALKRAPRTAHAHEESMVSKYSRDMVEGMILMMKGKLNEEQITELLGQMKRKRPQASSVEFVNELWNLTDKSANETEFKKNWGNLIDHVLASSIQGRTYDTRYKVPEIGAGRRTRRRNRLWRGRPLPIHLFIAKIQRGFYVSCRWLERAPNLDTNCTRVPLSIWPN
jgi:hypothetical protein